MLVVMQGQSSKLQKVARTAEIPQVPFVDRVVDAPGRDAEAGQRSVEVPQVQHLGRTVDAAMAMQRQASRGDARPRSHDQESSGIMSSTREQQIDMVANVPVFMRDSPLRDILAIRSFAVLVEATTVKTKQHSLQCWQKAVQSPSV